MANRIFYAIYGCGITPDGIRTVSSQYVCHGLQLIGLTLNFNLEQINELSQLEIYENIENIPDVEVTLEKVLDGYPLIYDLLTQAGVSNGPSLSNRQNAKASVVIGIWPDTQNTASGTPASYAECSGMFASAVTYTFPVDGPATESVTAVGNNIVWNSGSNPFVGPFYSNADQPRSITGSGGVQMREDVLFDTVYEYAMPADVNGASTSRSGTILPPDIPGINASGQNIRGSDGNYGAHIQGITVSTDLGREELFELGRRGPFHRFITFPTEVRCEIEVLSTAGHQVSATEGGISNGNNLTNRTIKIHAREGLYLNLGTKNKLSSVSQNGGDAAGGNVTVTYSYSNFNSLSISHPASGLVGLSAQAF